MKRTLAILVGAVAILALGSAAQAAVVSSNTYSDCGCGSSGKDTKAKNYGDRTNETLLGWTGDAPDYAYSVDINHSHSTGKYTFNNGNVTGSVTSNASSKNGSVSIGSSGIDLTANSGKSVSATFDLSKPAHYFGFEWDSASVGDSITFYGLDDKTVLGTINGSDLSSKDSSYYANFTSNLPIGMIVLTALGKGGKNMFNIDCISISSVPVPAALPMFGAAVAGLGALSKRRRKAATAA